MLRDPAESGERATQEHGGASVPTVSTPATPLPTLAEIGATRDKSSKWQQVVGHAAVVGAVTPRTKFLCDPALMTLRIRSHNTRRGADTMTKSLVHGVKVGLVLLAYLLSGALTQVVGGVIDGKTFWFAMLGSLVASAVLSLVIFALIRKFGSRATAATGPAITRRGLVVLAGAVAVVAGLGILASMGRVRDHAANLARQDAARSAAVARVQAEAARWAALSPEQQAAEIKAKELKAKEAAETKSRQAAAAAEAASAAAAAKARESAALIGALAGAKTLRDAMKNPEGFVIKKVMLIDDGSACYDYRATNSFNATMRGSAVLFYDGKKARFYVEENDGNRFVAAWNEHCTKSGRNITSTVAGILSR